MAQVTIEQAFQIALQHHQAGQLAQAEMIYRQILNHQPKHAEALHLLGIMAHQLGRNDQAVKLIRQSIALNPNSPNSHNNLGKALAEQGLVDESIAAYGMAISLQPQVGEIHVNLGNALREAGQLDEAIVSYRKAIALKPNYSEAHSNLGAALKGQGKLDEAIAALTQAIGCNPHYAEAYSNLSVALRESGRVTEAISCARQAVSLKPDYLQAHVNLGNALRDAGEFDNAVGAYRQAIVLKPSYAEAHSNLALTLLARGDFSAGWYEYEWRRKCKDFSSFQRNFAQPQWDGHSLAGATILLHAEQGFGDTIHAIRYVPMVVQRGAKVIVECQAELVPLIQPLAAGCVVVAQGQPLPTFDVQCPLLSLPRAFGTTFDSIPHHIPYLYADAEATAKWREKLAGDTNPIKVGLCWAGSKTYKSDRSRSIALSTLAPLASVRDVSFYSLQRRESGQDTRTVPTGLKLIDWTEDREDFSDTAGLIANLDLIISVETSVVQLAGAMGKPVWVLLAFVPDWRWLLEREDSPWYPTMWLFRQRKLGEWDDVVQRVAQALAGLTRQMK